MNTRNKYITAMDIYMSIISTYKSKGQEISPIEVMRWCSECITRYLKDPAGLIFHKGVCVLNGKDKKLHDGRITLPNDIFKLEAIRNAGGGLVQGLLYQGDYLIVPSTFKEQKISIDYYSLAVDSKTGFPLIKKGYESACEAYSIYKMFEEDATVIPPRVPQWRWLQIEQNKDWEIEAAHRSWDGMTDNELMEVHKYIVSPHYMEIVYGAIGQDINFEESHGNNC